ncbi:c-type cytochrome [Steroidobacter flavus]|uniref:C-type cytochrome n=1 Tax=Steroidobacter flavus TaxID=1842136 RepID=A0ABV8SZR5_9GAMM
MKHSIKALALLAALASVSGTVDAEVPAWAYALNPPAAQPAIDDEKPQRVPDSTASFTRREIAAITAQPPDWHPEEHPAMPGIVGRSREPRVYACAFCHLPNGAGRPENTNLAGLSANYIKAQITAFREDKRLGSEPRRAPQTNMIALAKELTDLEIEESATYFASLTPVSFIKVVESPTAPRTIVAGWMLNKAPGSNTEPIGDRIVELAEDVDRFENRDSRTPYIAYVPTGSLARGADLVATGSSGRTLPCAACHGADLKGVADVPRIVGRSPSYLFRQLYDMRGATRTGAASELMKPVVVHLTDADMVAIAAYLASRTD